MVERRTVVVELANNVVVEFIETTCFTMSIYTDTGDFDTLRYSITELLTNRAVLEPAVPERSRRGRGKARLHVFHNFPFTKTTNSVV